MFTWMMLGISTSLKTWIAAIGTLGLMSFAWRENRFYRIVEHTFVGLGAAHAMVMGLDSLKTIAFTPMMDDGQWWNVIPLILGVMLYFQLVPGKGWLARYPIAVSVGLGVALAFRGMILADFLTQIRATMVSLNAGSALDSINNIIVVVGVLTVLMFFIFTKERKPGTPLFYSATFGRWIMMIAFGALYANACMGRIVLMIGRVQFLLKDWLGIIGS